MSESVALTSRRACATVKYLTRAASTPLKDLTFRQAASDATRSSRNAWLSAARRIVHVRFADDLRRRMASPEPLNARCCCGLPGLVRARGSVLARLASHFRSTAVVSDANS